MRFFSRVQKVTERRQRSKITFFRRDRKKSGVVSVSVVDGSDTKPELRCNLEIKISAPS